MQQRPDRYDGYSVERTPVEAEYWPFWYQGLTVSDAVRLLLKKVVEEKKLPFDQLTPNTETIKAVHRRNVKTISSEADLFKELIADDQGHR
ncbi:MAG: hypothetical protein HGB22_08925 [Chlorobiaceae bacterium]|nr:hypothetical protein [Chlorobiaceae bacterium]